MGFVGQKAESESRVPGTYFIRAYGAAAVQQSGADG